MKNIIDILKGLGIEVPSEKTAELNKEVSENYKTVAEHEKRVTKVEKERDDYKKRAEEAENTLKDFEGKDFDEITKDRDAWKVKYENFVREQEEAKDQAELDEAIAAAIKEAQGRDEKSIKAHLDMAAIKTSKNRDKDISNAIKALADAEDTAFLFNSDPEDHRAKFTNPMNNGAGGKKALTKEEINKITNRSERRAAMEQYIAENGSFLN